MIFAPEPIGNIPVDSKFPLENYRRMIDKTLGEAQRAAAGKQFEYDVKKHINDIAEKYIIEGSTSDSAILFLPAEAIFAELHAYHDKLISYAHKKKVWITSPTTFMALLNTLQVVLKNIEREKYAGAIQKHIRKLSEDFERYRTRWDSLSKHIDTVQKDVKEINTTTKKISKSFDSISDVKIDEKTIENNAQEALKLNI
jgi:DNA recombination protein RmuC